MSVNYHEIIRRNSRPLEPLATGMQPRLRTLKGVRAVLFDVYGTMLISGSGDVGSASATGQERAFSEALAAVGLDGQCEGEAGIALMAETIGQHHSRSRGNGIEFPEVDICEVWEDLWAEVGARKANEGSSEIDLKQLALEYETRANPVWPMPHLEACLDVLTHHDVTLGVVSNAQFFTPELFPALLEKTLSQLGFAESLQFFSFEHGCSKPATYLYQLAVKSLESQGFKPDEVLYIGNDLLNDIMPAQRIGFWTALFAGDARSLRLRENDDRVTGVEPDLVITDLRDFPSCLTPNS